MIDLQDHRDGSRTKNSSQIIINELEHENRFLKEAKKMAKKQSDLNEDRIDLGPDYYHEMGSIVANPYSITKILE